jgi:hypothetical protein
MDRVCHHEMIEDMSCRNNDGCWITLLKRLHSCGFLRPQFYNFAMVLAVPFMQLFLVKEA